MTEELHAVPVAGGQLAMTLHLPSRAPAPVIVAFHGLGASRDSDKYRLLGDELPRSGWAVARFDFRGAGDSSGTPRDATVATRIEDGLGILARLAGDPRLDAGRCGLIGSSLGGFIALHVAARRGQRTPVVTWNAPATLAALLDAESQGGGVLGPAFFAELRGGALATAPRRLRWLRIIHGDRDEVVPSHHARQLFAAAEDPRDLSLIAGGDHRLSDPSCRAEAIRLTRDWFAAHL